MYLRIREICKQRGITQKELAQKIGISAVGLSKAIKGNPTIKTLDNIADALGVKVWDLFEKDKTLTCPKCNGIGFALKKKSSEISLRCNSCGYSISDGMENNVLEKIAYISGYERVSMS
jgi:transcriptional regulator with XRE-family HTH domain